MTNAAQKLAASILLTVAIGFACSGFSLASQVTLSFEDLDPYQRVPASYGGINWEMGLAGYQSRSGYATAIGPAQGARANSGEIAIVNEWGVRQLGFTFDSGLAHFHGAWFAVHGTVESQMAPLIGFVGYRKGKTVYLSQLLQPTTLPTYLPANFKDVDRVEIIAAAGSNGSGGWYNMDGLTYTPVPEPASLVVLGAAGGVFGLRLLRTRRL